MNPRIKRRLLSIIALLRRCGLRNRSFTIISNNCWAGIVYDRFGLQYKTPTIGLYFFSVDYIEFINNLERYLSVDVVPLAIENSKYKNILLERHGKEVLLGSINGKVEIVFLHYKSVEEACRKWNYRRKRVDFSNILIQFNDQNLFKAHQLDSFWKVPFTNKVFLTANKELAVNSDCILFSDSCKATDGTLKNDLKESFSFSM